MPVISGRTAKLSFSPELTDRVSAMCKESGDTESELIQKALNMYEACLIAKRKGHLVGVADKVTEKLIQMWKF